MLTNTKSPVTHDVYRAHLKEKIFATQKQIRENISIANARQYYTPHPRNQC